MHFAKEASYQHAVLRAILMDSFVKPPAEDDIRVVNQHTSKKRRTKKRQHAGDDEDDAMVRKKPKDPPQPEPLL